jgi:hypothetical protein
VMANRSGRITIRTDDCRAAQRLAHR